MLVAVLLDSLGFFQWLKNVVHLVDFHGQEYGIVIEDGLPDSLAVPAKTYS